jgi:hypothetical protein
MRFSQLSPDAQKILKQLVAWKDDERRFSSNPSFARSKPVPLDADARVVFNTPSTGGFGLNVQVENNSKIVRSVSWSTSADY